MKRSLLAKDLTKTCEFIVHSAVSCPRGPWGLPGTVWGGEVYLTPKLISGPVALPWLLKDTMFLGQRQGPYSGAAQASAWMSFPWAQGPTGDAAPEGGGASAEEHQPGPSLLAVSMPALYPGGGLASSLKVAMANSPKRWARRVKSAQGLSLLATQQEHAGTPRAGGRCPPAPTAHTSQ